MVKLAFEIAELNATCRAKDLVQLHLEVTEQTLITLKMSCSEF